MDRDRKLRLIQIIIVIVSIALIIIINKIFNFSSIKSIILAITIGIASGVAYYIIDRKTK